MGFFSRPTTAAKLGGKEDIVFTARAFAVALAEGDRANEPVKAKHSYPTRFPPNSGVASQPSTPEEGSTGARREDGASEEDVSQPKQITTIEFVAHAVPPARGKRRHLFATAIITLGGIAGVAMLLVTGVNLEVLQDFYVRAIGELRGLATKTAEHVKETGKLIEPKLEDTAAASRHGEEAINTANQRATFEAGMQAAEETARAFAQETPKHQAADAPPLTEAPPLKMEQTPAAQKSRTDAEMRRTAQSREADLNLNEQDRKKVQASLTALGSQIPLTGYFGPPTRSMIAAWQKGQGLPETGFLDEHQLLALHEQAGSAKRADQTKATAVQQAEKQEAALNLSEQDRKKVQVALNALGHAIPTATGYFGPRTRATITAWQKSQGVPATGFLTGTQVTTLWQQAAPALEKYIQGQKKL
ncbi:Putative peptidoglycan binding domain-containing protein [Rhodospirillales bacterium URHD0017]|nr:Putative peptidoglycan binding domain-containing protein [Rhodospirillales bacterium URHD0017]